MKTLFVTLVVLLCSIETFADVRLPDLLASSMVLQQKQVIPIWGFADPGEKVTVEIAGQKKTTVAGPDGKWRVDLGKLAANFKPQTMTISGKNKIDLTYRLVG